MKRYRLVLLAVLDIILAVLLGGSGFVLFFTDIGRGSPRATFSGARTVGLANLPGFGRNRLFSSRASRAEDSSPTD